MILKTIPSTWQDLQKSVAKILSESGFIVKINKKIKTARGSVEIDVYAEEQINNRTNILLCECKFWNTNIP